MERWRRVYSLPIFYMLLSAACLAIGFLFVKLASVKFEFYQLVFIRFFVGFLCSVGLLLFKGTLKSITEVEGFRYHLLRAFIVLISQYCFFYFLSKNSLLNGTILVAIAPLFIPLFNRLLFNIPIEKATYIGEGVSLLGILLMYHPKGQLFGWVTLIGLTSSVLWALSQSIFAYTLKKTKSENGLFYLYFLVSLLSLPGLIFFPTKKLDIALEPLSLTNFIILFSIGLFSFLNLVYRAKAYKLGDAAKLTTLLYFSVFVAIFLDWSVFNQVPTLTQWMGSIIVIIGGFFSIYLHKSIH